MFDVNIESEIPVLRLELLQSIRRIPDIGWGDVFVIRTITVGHPVHPDVAALARMLAAITRFELPRLIRVEGISRERLRQIRERELPLRMGVVTEDDPRGVLVRGVIDRETGQRRQGLTRHEVLMAFLEHRLRRPDVILAIGLHRRPELLVNRLVPWESEFVMVDAQFDLPLLQTLLLRGEVEDIGVGDVIGVAEHRILVAVHDPLTEVVQRLVVVLHPSPGVQHVIVVLAVVEADQVLGAQRSNGVRARVDERRDDILIAVLVADHEQIREHLDIEEREHRDVRRFRGRNNLLGSRLEPHVRHDLDAVIRMMGRTHGELQYRIAHVGHVIDDAVLIRLVKELADEVDVGLGAGSALLPQTLPDEIPQMGLVLDGFLVDHTLSLLLGKPA